MAKVIVCSNLIEKEGTFLVVKETKQVARNNYNFPSGTLEDNEKLLDCAIREAEEETGFKVKLEGIVGIFQIPASEMGNNIVIIVFKSEIVTGELTHSKEHPEVEFVTLDRIKELHEQGVLRHNSYMMHAIDNFLKGRVLSLDCVKSI
jgi:8-oxo-dGTP diphosphatase